MLADMVDKRVCPRCKGFVKSNQDSYGKYNECLQCGYIVDVVISRDRTQSGPPTVTYSAPHPQANRTNEMALEGIIEDVRSIEDVDY